MTFEGDTEKWKQIKRFVVVKEATVTARYYNRHWHIMVIWDNGNDGIVEGIHQNFAAAVEFAWNKVEAITNNRP